MLGLAFALTAALPSASRPYCTGYVQPHSAAIARADALLVGGATHRGTVPSSIDRVMADHDWRLIWASPADSERGVFFFRRTATGYRLVDIWGGVALASERVATAAWAGKLGVPTALARCFAEHVVGGE